MRFKSPTSLFVVLALVGPIGQPPPPHGCDEGLWPFDHPPLELLARRYDFRPDRGWFEHLRNSTVRLSNGGTAALVSAEGLLITNHHLVLRHLQEANSQDLDLLAKGFIAAKREEEIRCKGLSASILVECKDVTAQIRDAEDPSAAIRTIESTKEAAGFYRRVHRLYRGGAYSLHRYRRYADVRLVFAPEMSVAFFGGHQDNFNYPRYCLDIAMLRIYEADKPVVARHFLKPRSKGPTRQELVFVAGHPSATKRRLTLAQLESLRDVMYPAVVRGLRARTDALKALAKRPKEKSSRVDRGLWRAQNSLKFFEQQLEALRSEELFAHKRAGEERFMASDEGSGTRPSFERIASARARYAESYRLRWVSRLPGDLPILGRAMLGIAQRNASKPTDPEPLLKRLGQRKADKEADELLLAATLEAMQAELGQKHPFVMDLLQDKSPVEMAAHLVKNTDMYDPECRSEAASRVGLNELDKLEDPMLSFLIRARKAVETHRTVMKESAAIERTEMDKIARVCFQKYGRKAYPKADGTLRLSFGTVQGYTSHGHRIPYKTTIGGLLDRHDSFDGKEPYHLPRRLLSARGKLKARTPLNFVCTADISDGSSGSPVVDKDSRWLGVVFDGNRESLGNMFVYDDKNARTVAVSAKAVFETLERVYGATELVRELRGK